MVIHADHSLELGTQGKAIFSELGFLAEIVFFWRLPPCPLKHQFSQGDPGNLKCNVEKTTNTMANVSPYDTDRDKTFGILRVTRTACRVPSIKFRPREKFTSIGVWIDQIAQRNSRNSTPWILTKYSTEENGLNSWLSHECSSRTSLETAEVIPRQGKGEGMEQSILKSLSPCEVFVEINRSPCHILSRFCSRFACNFCCSTTLFLFTFCGWN